MNSSPASSYARASSSSTRSASRAVISPIRYASILTPASSIAASTAVSGSSISRRAAHEPRSATRSRSAAPAAAAPRPAGQARPSPPRPRLRQDLEPVLGGELVERVLGAARLDQVGGEQRVVGGLHVSRAATSRRGRRSRRRERGRSRGSGADDDAVLRRDRERSRRPPRARPARRATGSSPSRHGTSSRRPRRRGGRQRLVELVDPAEQVRGTRTAGTSPCSCERSGGESTSFGRIAVDVEVAPHRRELLRHTRLLGVLEDVLPARRRELVGVLDHGLERAVLRDELAGGLVADPGDAGDVVGRVALEPDEVRHLVGPDAVAGLDALGRVDLDVGDAARRHHQADVLGAELECVAVGRDDARPDPGLVRARRERRDHVVGLPALELEVPVAEGLDDRPEVRELLARAGRASAAAPPCTRAGARRGARPRVPRDRDATRPVVGEQLEEHVREPEQRVRRLAVARRELLREREERAVGEVVAVHEEELGVARGRVVELELDPGQRLRHDSNGIVLARWDAWRRNRSPTRASSAAERGNCSRARHRVHAAVEPLVPARVRGKRRGRDGRGGGAGAHRSLRLRRGRRCARAESSAICWAVAADGRGLG